MRMPTLMDTLGWLVGFVWGDHDIVKSKPEKQQQQQQHDLDIGSPLPEAPEAWKSEVPVDELDQKTKPIPIPSRGRPRAVEDLEHSLDLDIWGKTDITAYRGRMGCRRIRGKSPYPDIVDPDRDIGDEGSDEESNEENDDVIMEPHPLQEYPYAGEALKAPKGEIMTPPLRSFLTEGLQGYRGQIEGEQSSAESENTLSRRQNRIMRALEAEGEKTRIPVFKKPGTMEWRFEGGTMNETAVPVWIRQPDDVEA
ncbi:hypothetical protein GGR51DRAFT_573958 [Nemania sp. FL0031]|nr:hypothetical protein GGR51DRAFT_573958 [Nemania sp. FL0031]